MIDRVQFRPGDLEEALLRRIDPAEGGTTEAAAARVARRDLERYYDLLQDAMSAVAHDLSLAEARWIVAAHWSTYLDQQAALLLPAQLHDYAADPEGREYAAAWGVDPATLIRRVRDWSLTRRMALIDAIERLRCMMAARRSADDVGGDDPTLDTLIIAVGMTRPPT